MIWGFAGISGSFLVAAFSVNQLHATVPVYRLTFSQRAPRNARPLEVGGVARFDCDRSTQEFTCYMAWPAFPQRSHLRVDDQFAAKATLPWRYWFRWGCSASSTTSFIADLAGGHILYPRSTGPDHAALHPFRRDTPVTSRCTRYVAIHPIRRGAMPTDRVHHLPQQAQPRAIPPDTPQPFASDAATQLRHARPAPNERRCTS